MIIIIYEFFIIIIIIIIVIIVIIIIVIIIFITLQKFNFELRKNVIVTKRFIPEPNLFRPNLKPNKFAFFNLTNYHDLKLTMVNKSFVEDKISATS